MMIRTRWLALITGYQSECDLPHGFSIGLFPRKDSFGSRYQVKLTLAFAAPQPVWYDRNWHANEMGYLTSLPVARAKPKRWLLRGLSLPLFLSIYIPRWNWEWQGPRRFPYIGGRLQAPKAWYEHE